MNCEYNPIPQAAPGASAAVGHNIENSIPLSIFPIATDKFCICFCGLPGRGKTHISRRLAKYLSFFHAVSVELFNVSEYRRKVCGALKDADWFDSKNQEAWYVFLKLPDSILFSVVASTVILRDFCSFFQCIVKVSPTAVDCLQSSTLSPSLLTYSAVLS